MSPKLKTNTSGCPRGGSEVVVRGSTWYDDEPSLPPETLQVRPDKSKHSKRQVQRRRGPASVSTGRPDAANRSRSEIDSFCARRLAWVRPRSSCAASDDADRATDVRGRCIAEQRARRRPPTRPRLCRPNRSSISTGSHPAQRDQSRRRNLLAPFPHPASSSRQPSCTP